MFALFMVIIAAFIETEDPGQEMYQALTFADAGRRLVIGLCVARAGSPADRLITGWSKQCKKRLELD